MTEPQKRMLSFNAGMIPTNTDPRDVFYLLVCRDCGDDGLPLVFSSAEERGRWAGAHTRGTRHDRWLVWEKPRERER